jgi:hypothetical protein
MRPEKGVKSKRVERWSAYSNELETRRELEARTVQMQAAK